MSGHCERPHQNDRYKLGARKTCICRSLITSASPAEIYKTHPNSLESRDLSACTPLHILKDHCLQMPKGLLETNEALFLLVKHKNFREAL